MHNHNHHQSQSQGNQVVGQTTVISDPTARPGQGGALRALREFGSGTRGGASRPSTRGEFNFEQSNEKMAQVTSALLGTAGGEEGEAGAVPHLADAAYNKSSSFYDNLQSGSGGMRRDDERR